MKNFAKPLRFADLFEPKGRDGPFGEECEKAYQR
jgi:hypothetical protein